MSDDKHREDEAIDRRDLDCWTTEDPPADFAERVLAARGRPARVPDAGGRSLRTWGVVVVAIAGVIVVSLALRKSGRFPPSKGEVSADERSSIQIGRRGVAVVEAGTRLSWRVDSHGSAIVDQEIGNTFYRVNAGGKFEVVTPKGRIEVTGTCFRVEIDEMKIPKSPLIGAAVGAALVLTVYEGKVLFADRAGNSKELGAGERLAIDGDDSLVASDAELKPPQADVTRAQLLERDAAQRDKIAALQEELGNMRSDLAAARKRAREDDEGDEGPWFDPSPETLRRFAAECRVRYDLPPGISSEPRELPPQVAAKYGLSEAERVAANQVVAEMHKDWRAQLAELYIEATGDTHGVDMLSISAMADEIKDKSRPGEVTGIQKRISAEKAGLLAPPKDWSALSPLERYFRLLVTKGEELERRLGNKIGAERAREFRSLGGGWPTRMEISGCDEDNEAGERH